MGLVKHAAYAVPNPRSFGGWLIRLSWCERFGRNMLRHVVGCGLDRTWFQLCGTRCSLWSAWRRNIDRACFRWRGRIVRSDRIGFNLSFRWHRRSRLKWRRWCCRHVLYLGNRGGRRRGSATGFTKAFGADCRTSTSIAGGALLPGPGKVISSGSIAATQSPCTAPAPSTQSGRVIERLSVKGRSFRGAAALFRPRTSP
jgi:hypothetical protein